jgi:hypothetical protein
MKYTSIVVLIIALLFTTASATVWYVHPDSTMNCIQDCLDSCSAGDTVLVGPGIYYENIVWPNTQGIQLISVFGPDTTIIDGNSTTSVIQISNVDSTTVIRGFTIRNGYATFGGGLWIQTNSSPTITENIITGNTAGMFGGGIFINNNSSPIVTGNNVTNNHSYNSGGGIGAMSITSVPYIIGNTITGNTADTTGGGIHCSTSPAIISGNTINGNSACWGGGIGFYSQYTTSSTVDSNFITNNTAQNTGGGVYCHESSPDFQYNIISGNVSYYNGGSYGSGIRFYSNCDSEVKKCTISFNIGTGIGCRLCSPTIDSCTISDNTLDGINCTVNYSSRPIIFNCNIKNNGGYGVYNPNSADTVDARSNWWGNPSGPGGSGPGTGDEVSDYVLFDPWLQDSVEWVGIEEHKVSQPVATALHINPNPFCNRTEIRYMIQDPGYTITDMVLKIFDATGRLVKDFRITPDALSNTLYWDGRDGQNRMLGSGVYFVKFAVSPVGTTGSGGEAGGYTETKKLLLIK